MTQLATVLASRSDLYISRSNKLAILKPTIIPQSLVLNGQENSLFAIQSSLFYHDSVRFSFTLNKKYSKHFIAVKGLLEFNRLAGFQFTYNRNEKSVALDIPTSKRNELNALFHFVERQLQEELQFKKYLKQAIAFERQYQIEKARVYHFIPD